MDLFEQLGGLRNVAISKGRTVTNMQNEASRSSAVIRYGQSTVRRRIKAMLGALAIGGGVFATESAAADPFPFPSEDFTMQVWFCTGGFSFSECTGDPVEGGNWTFHPDASVTWLVDGAPPGSSPQGVWDEVAPGQLFVEFHNVFGWMFSVVAYQVGDYDPNDGNNFYPCFDGVLDDWDIAVVSVRLCFP